LGGGGVRHPLIHFMLLIDRYTEVTGAVSETECSVCRPGYCFGHGSCRISNVLGDY
jgi:hypothetical protein